MTLDVTDSQCLKSVEFRQGDWMCRFNTVVEDWENLTKGFSGRSEGELTNEGDGAGKTSTDCSSICWSTDNWKTKMNSVKTLRQNDSIKQNA